MTLIAQYILPLCLMVAAISDIRTRRIPNWISVVLITSFLLVGLIEGFSLGTLSIHMGIGLCVLICGFILFAFNVVGGGDAKLLASCAVWMGPEAALTFLVLTALSGGLFSLGVLMFRQMPLPVTAVKVDWISRLHMQGSGIPYGLAIAVGGIASLIASDTHPYTIY